MRRSLASEEQLRIAGRRKDEFLATLAHELLNPLAPLRAALQVLNAGAGNRSLYAVMERQVDQLVRLVDDLLEVSRISHGSFELRKESLELGAVVRNALETSEPLISERIII